MSFDVFVVLFALSVSRICLPHSLFSSCNLYQRILIETLKYRTWTLAQLRRTPLKTRCLSPKKYKKHKITGYLLKLQMQSLQLSNREKQNTCIEHTVKVRLGILLINIPFNLAKARSTSKSTNFSFFSSRFTYCSSCYRKDWTFNGSLKFLETLRSNLSSFIDAGLSINYIKSNFKAESVFNVFDNHVKFVVLFNSRIQISMYA